MFTKKFLSLLCATALISTISVNAFAASPNTVIIDTGRQLSVLPNGTYQFKITAASKPTFVCGNGSIFQVRANGSKGYDYFFKVTAIGKVGDSAGFYVNREKVPRTVGTIASADVTLDTGKQLSVQPGKTYQFKVTSAFCPTFICGNNSVFQVRANGSKGHDYFFKVTAIGKVGDSAGFYVNRGKTPRTVGTIVSGPANVTGDLGNSGGGISTNSGANSGGNSSAGGGTSSGSNPSQSVNSLGTLQTALNDPHIKSISVDQPITLNSNVTIPNGKTVTLNKKMTVNGTLNLNGVLQTKTETSMKVFQHSYSLVKAISNMAESDTMLTNAVTHNADAKLEIGATGIVQAENGSSVSFANLDDIITPSEKSLLLYSGANVEVAGKQYVGTNRNNAFIQLSKFDDSDSSSPAGGFFLNGDNKLLLVVFQRADVLRSDKNILNLNLLVKAGENGSKPGLLSIPNFDILHSDGSIIIEANATLVSGNESIISAKDSKSIFNATGGDTDNRRGVIFKEYNSSLYTTVHGDAIMNRAFRINGCTTLIKPENFGADNFHKTALTPTLRINFDPQKDDFALDTWLSAPQNGQIYREQNSEWVSKSDATLQSLKINGENLKNFNHDVKDYTVTVSNDVTKFPEVTASARNDKATVDTMFSKTFPGKAALVLTAEDGITTGTYTITFNHE